MVKPLTLAAAALPLVRAHMSMWHPSMYGFEESYTPVTPLAGMSFNQWWFHGFTNDRPSEVMTLIPGQDINIEIACGKRYSSWGNEPNPDGCPSDAGSFHAGGSIGSRSGWGGNSESNLVGCALAIAFKSTAAEVQPEDFTVMSVQERCVRQRDTPFSIPANLPACPPGGCTCAWFWQGKNSADEMYMIGFRCDVQGGVVTNDYPRPAPPRRGSTITGPTQPMYWANSNTNLDYTPNWSTKPSYNSAFGWVNGAQTSAFGAGGGSSGGGGGAGGGTSNTTRSASPTSSQYGNDDNDNEWTPSTTSSSQWGEPTGNGNDNGNGGWNESASSTSSRRRRPRPSSDAPHSGYDSQTGRPTWYNHNAVPTSSSSSSVSVVPESSAASTPSPAPSPPSPSPSTGSGGKTCKRRSRKRRSQRAHAIAV